MGGKKKTPPKQPSFSTPALQQLKESYALLISGSDDDKAKVESIVFALKGNHEMALPSSATPELIAKAKQVLADKTNKVAGTTDCVSQENMSRTGSYNTPFSTPSGEESMVPHTTSLVSGNTLKSRILSDLELTTLKNHYRSVLIEGRSESSKIELITSALRQGLPPSELPPSDTTTLVLQAKKLISGAKSLSGSTLPIPQANGRKSVAHVNPTSLALEDAAGVTKLVNSDDGARDLFLKDFPIL